MNKRYTKFPFPPHKYLPGLTERHAEDCSDVVTQSIDYSAESVVKFDPLFLYSLDLINNGFFWEAHESLEVLWNRDYDESVIKNVQSIILLCAASLKLVLGPEYVVGKLIGKAEFICDDQFDDQMGFPLSLFIDSIKEAQNCGKSSFTLYLPAPSEYGFI